MTGYDGPFINFCRIFQKSGGKLTGGYVDLGEDNEPAKKKRKIVVRTVRPTIGSQFRGADTSAIKQVL